MYIHISIYTYTHIHTYDKHISMHIESCTLRYAYMSTHTYIIYVCTYSTYHHIYRSYMYIDKYMCIHIYKSVHCYTYIRKHAFHDTCINVTNLHPFIHLFVHIYIHTTYAHTHNTTHTLHTHMSYIQYNMYIYIYIHTHTQDIHIYID